jgi:3-deoxy-D-manno-octulosonic-acid transferase
MDYNGSLYREFTMHVLINCIYCVAILLYSPKILYRMVAHKRYRGGWDQRMGRIARRRPESPCVWIHAVSVGEVNALRTLVAQLHRTLGDHEIVISSTTDTGKARADALFGAEHSVFYFPFDLSWVMRRALDRLRPDLILLMELEVWPNLTALASRRQIPVAVINGRLSDKSFPRYQKIRFLIRRMFAKVSLVLAQTEQYASRFIDLGCGAGKVIVTSSLKYDTAQTAGPVPGADRLAEQICLGSEPLWVAGGTGPGEEKIVLDIFARLRRRPGLEGLRLAVVPRKPERFEEVAALIEQAGLACTRYSRLKADNTTAAEKTPVILGDTMGDLKKFYAAATVVFVGRSLVPMGGSDMMEPSGLGKCTLFGPHTFNFRQTVEVLLEGKGAIETADAGALEEQTLKCLTDAAFAENIARAGQEVIRRNQGATDKTVKAVVDLLNNRG